MNESKSSQLGVTTPSSLQPKPTNIMNEANNINTKFRIHYARVGNPSYSRAATENWDSFKLIEAPTIDDALARFIEKYTFIILDDKTIGYRVPYIDQS